MGKEIKAKAIRDYQHIRDRWGFSAKCLKSLLRLQTTIRPFVKIGVKRAIVLDDAQIQTNVYSNNTKIDVMKDRMATAITR